MAPQKTFCLHHPDRRAVGVCVETKKPICGECSTRYNGVNYSREGLEILRRRREQQHAASSPWPGLLGLGLVVSAGLFAAYYASCLFLAAMMGPS